MLCRCPCCLKRPLRGLRSWTTIGTPFMQHRSPGAISIKNLLGLMVGLILLLPALAAPKQLVKTLYSVAINSPTALVLKPEAEVGYANVLRAPVLAFVECFGIAVERSPEGVKIGSFDPAGSQSLAQYFFASPEGLFLLGLMIGISYFCIHCIALCVAPVLETFRVRLEQRLHQRAFEHYRARWLGLWSPDDEAINGLRATLQISVSFVKKMVPREVVFLSDMFGLLSRPYFWLFAPLYNRFVQPTVDGQIRNLVIRAAQGSDRPGAKLIDVTPCPMSSEAFTAPPLPALLNVKLLSFANRHAHELVPKLRQLIGRTSFTSGLETFGKQLSGKELVHTAYFEQEEVLQLIAANIHWETAEANQVAGLESMPPWLRKWFVTFKQALGSEQGPEANQQQKSVSKESESLELPRKVGDRSPG